MSIGQGRTPGRGVIDRASLRMSAALLLAGQVLHIVVTQFHTGGEANDHPATSPYASSGIWKALPACWPGHRIVCRTLLQHRVDADRAGFATVPRPPGPKDIVTGGGALVLDMAVVSAPPAQLGGRAVRPTCTSVTSAGPTLPPWSSSLPPSCASQLASQGMSNKDVAELCWISPRTVTYHLRNVFTKTRVTSRG